MAESLVLDAQGGVLAGLGVEGLDLLEPELEDLDLAGAVAGRLAQGGQLTAHHSSSS